MTVVQVMLPLESSAGIARHLTSTGYVLEAQTCCSLSETKLGVKCWYETRSIHQRWTLRSACAPRRTKFEMLLWEIKSRCRAAGNNPGARRFEPRTGDVAGETLDVFMGLLIFSRSGLIDPLVACRLGSVKGDRCFAKLAPATGQSLLIADLLDSCWLGVGYLQCTGSQFSEFHPNSLGDIVNCRISQNS